MFSGQDAHTQDGATGRESVLAAVERRQLEARFQPIVDLRRGEIAAYEALTRPSPESGFSNPLAFFDEAERTGVLWEVEEATRGIAFDAAARWPAGVLLFMNCSPQVIADPRFVESLREGLSRAGGVPPSRVVLEITERSDAQADTTIVEQVDRLRDEGFQIAIDDVGAGTSGLTRIMSIRPSWLKVDRELIEHIHEDRSKQNLLRFLLHFARLSGVRLVAEGIECYEELSTLLELGVPYGQGYLLGRPGGHGQTLDQALRERIRGGWAGAAGVRYRDPRAISIAAFARTTPEVDASQMIAETAGECLRDRRESGVLVYNGDELLGWVSREHVLRAASDQRSDSPIKNLGGFARTTVQRDATVVEALELAAAREAAHSGEPIIVCDGEQVLGVVSTRDLLTAAADVCRMAQTRTSSSTGLPGRVICEQHLAHMLEERREQGATSAPGPDAAFIDIRGLMDYNTAFGHDLGDELIQSLVGALSAAVQSAGRDAFLGHLGDDRFLLVASPGRIRGLVARVAEQFDRALRHSTRALELGAGAGKSVGLRALIAIDPFTRVDSVRGLFEFEGAMRDVPAPSADGLPPSALAVFDEPRARLGRAA
ncbi:MAG: EAL domain-containing protein [Phycisphaerales bacterium]